MATKSPNPKSVRKTYLIYPQFQVTLVAINAAASLACFGAIFWVVQGSFRSLINLGKAANLGEGHPFFNFLILQEQMLYPRLMLVFGAGMLIVSVVTIILSQKLAGPIVRLASYFSRIVETGELSGRLEFRKGDFFSELPRTINSALNKIGTPKTKRKVI